MTRTRGGKRPGAGAPKGNQNAHKGAVLRALMRELTDAQRAQLAAVLQTKSIKLPAAPPVPENVVPLRALPTTTTTTRNQSDDAPTPHAATVHHLERYGFRGALDFARRHHRYTAAIEAVLAYVDQLTDDAYAALSNPAGLIRDTVHREIATPFGDAVVCPACRWTDAPTHREETGT